MYSENCFITLTYDDANLKSPRLDYRDFQLFMKKLRRAHANTKISVFTAGEYGDRGKRPHWHAIIFNFTFPDLVFKRSNDNGDKIFTSALLEKIWSKGICEVGDVTFQSAGYVARYASKKLIHGKDGEHNYEPISRRSTKHAIGKAWLEKFWPDVFNHGYVVLPDGARTSVPRYYEKWFKKTHPDLWWDYVTQTKYKIQKEAEAKEALQTQLDKKANLLRSARKGLWKRHKTRNEARKKILEQKFQEQLQKNLKL